MYENLKGKKLLIVGSQFESEIVKAAQQMGVYTVVLDNILDRNVALAKNVADEAWDISYGEYDQIVELCKKNGIDGVFAGYGETRVLAACRIAERLGTPFYATEEQIDLTRDKALFKQECIKHGVPVPRNYCENLTEEEKDAVEYPVIVKPTDRSGRIGITVCRNREELDKAIEFALSLSACGKVVVEDYLEGTEFSVIYTASKGEYSLSCVNAKYITKDQKFENLLCDCAIAPAAYVDRFEKEVDASLKSFLAGIGVVNGMANFQGMVTDKGIYVFEIGLRINGNNDWKVIEEANGINFAKMMMAYSLCGDTCEDLSKDNPRFKEYFCTIPIYAHGGVIASMDYEKVLEQDWAQISTVNVAVGAEILEDGTGRQKLFSFLIRADKLDQLKERIKFIQENISAVDTNGNDMLFLPFDTDQLVASIG